MMLRFACWLLCLHILFERQLVDFIAASPYTVRWHIITKSLVVSVIKIFAITIVSRAFRFIRLVLILILISQIVFRREAAPAMDEHVEEEQNVAMLQNEDHFEDSAEDGFNGNL